MWTCAGEEDEVSMPSGKSHDCRKMAFRGVTGATGGVLPARCGATSEPVSLELSWNMAHDSRWRSVHSMTASVPNM